MEPCIQEQAIGKLQEFVESTKGFKPTLFTIAIAIVIQVSTFLFLWGSLTTTVKENTGDIRELGPRSFENTRNIDRILTKLDYIVNDKM